MFLLCIRHGGFLGGKSPKEDYKSTDYKYHFDLIVIFVQYPLLLSTGTLTFIIKFEYQQMYTIAIFLLMPIIATVAGVKIYMYFRDHNPPHFHAKHDGKDQAYDLEGNRLWGKIDKKKSKKVSRWAKKNSGFLKDKWDKHQK